MKQCDLSAEKFIWNTFVLFFSPQAIVDKFSEMFVFSVLYILTFISPKFVRLCKGKLRWRRYSMCYFHTCTCK